MAPGRCSHSSGGLTSLVSVLERGHVDGVTVATVRRVAQALGIRLDLMVRWRAGDLDRLLNAGRVLALAAGTPRASAAGVVIAEGDANRRRALAHAATLRSAFPANSDTFVMRLADEAPFHALIARSPVPASRSCLPRTPSCRIALFAHARLSPLRTQRNCWQPRYPGRCCSTRSPCTRSRAHRHQPVSAACFATELSSGARFQTEKKLPTRGRHRRPGRGAVVSRRPPTGEESCRVLLPVP